jgi:hypothetical protein
MVAMVVMIRDKPKFTPLCQNLIGATRQNRHFGEGRKSFFPHVRQQEWIPSFDGMTVEVGY